MLTQIYSACDCLESKAGGLAVIVTHNKTQPVSCTSSLRVQHLALVLILRA